MLGTLGRRVVDWVVLGFALYAFCFVPLGKRTGLEHLRAVLATDAAQDAKVELQEAGGKLVGEILKSSRAKVRPMRGEPTLPELAPANLHLTPAPAEESLSDTPDASL